MNENVAVLRNSGVQNLDENRVRHETLHGLFARRAAKQPEAIAIVDRGVSISYAELGRRAERLADQMTVGGVESGDIVALALDRGVNLIAAMIAVLRIGAAYVPVDPRYPSTRREFVLADCGASAVVIDAPGGAAIQPTALSARRRADNRIAYVIYTSGSTGVPKGVMVTHSNVLRLFFSSELEFGFSSSDIWSGFHSPSFDFSVWEIWGALLYGGTYVVVPVETARDPAAFTRLLRAHSVTVLNQTPSAFRNLMTVALAEDFLPALRLVIFGGERLDAVTLKPWADRVGLERPALVNMYGITETTVHVTHRKVRQIDLKNDGPSLIGSPLRDLSIRIVLPDGTIAPLGTPGVIHVGGAGVALGYLGREDLTAQRFYAADDPSGMSVRWYDSGDIGVEVEERQYAYVGRADRQIKIRGYRIEPAEIEAALRDCPAVVDCAVDAVDFPGNDRRICAVVIVGEEAFADATAVHHDILNCVRKILPAYMCPAHLCLRRSFPINQNGKLDVAACFSKEFERNSAGESDRKAHLEIEGWQNENAVHASPKHSEIRESQTEKEIRAIWAEILAGDNIALDTNFFWAGGDSLNLVRMLGEVAWKYDVELDLTDIMDYLTLSMLAERVDQLLLEKKTISNVIYDQIAGARAGHEFESTPISIAQAAHWIIREDRRPFVCRVAIKTSAGVDKISEAIRFVTNETPILRSFFVTRCDGIFLGYHEAVSLQMLPDLPQEASSDVVVSHLSTAAALAEPFHIYTGPLFRAYVCRVGRDASAFLLDISHIIVDGRSTELISSMLRRYIEARSDVAAVTRRFENFIDEEREFVTVARMEAAEKYWRGLLKPVHGYAQLMNIKGRPFKFDFTGVRVDISFGRDIDVLLKRSAAAHKCTISQVIFSVFGEFILSQTASHSVCVSFPIENRHLPGYEKAIGYFANQTICIFEKLPHLAPIQRLRSTRDQLIQSMRWNWYPYHSKERLLEFSENVAYCSKVQFKYSHKSTTPNEEIRDPNRNSWNQLSLHKNGITSAINEIGLYTKLVGEQVSGYLIFSSDLFDESKAAHVTASFRALLVRFCTELTAPD